MKVKVLAVEAPRKRISLSMLLDAPVGKAAKPEGTGKAYGGGLNHHRNAPRSHQEPARGNSAMADAFAKLKR